MLAHIAVQPSSLAMRQRKCALVVNFTQGARRRGRAQGASRLPALA